MAAPWKNPAETIVTDTMYARSARRKRSISMGGSIVIKRKMRKTIKIKREWFKALADIVNIIKTTEDPVLKKNWENHLLIYLESVKTLLQ